MNRPDYESAARAAGYEIRFHSGTCKGGEYEGCEIKRGDEWVAWRPLDDAGDAFMLALDAGVEFGRCCVSGVDSIEARMGRGWLSAPLEHYRDEYEAARAAIFRAAVALGKCLP